MLQRLFRIAMLWLVLCAPAYASQATWQTPGPPLPMTSLATFLNNAFAAVGTCNSGTSAPTSGPAGAPIAQMCWWNTASTPWTLNWYDGSQWNYTLTLNASTHQVGLTNLPLPVNASDAATKQYVDNSVAGLTPHTAAALATAAALPANTYNNGTGGVGATLTANANGNLVVDGTTNPTAGTRILVKNESTAANNGIYTVTTTGGASQAYVLTRATDANSPGPQSATAIGFGTYVLVLGGSTQTNSSWFVNSTVTTIGTSAITWAQFLGAFSGVVSVGGQCCVIGLDSTLHFTSTNLGLNLATNNTWTGGVAINVNGGATVPLLLDTPAINEFADIQFNDHGTGKWQIGKLTSNNFYIFDVAGNTNVLQIVPSGNLSLMPFGNGTSIGSTANNPAGQSVYTPAFDLVNTTSGHRAILELWSNVAPTSNIIYGQIGFYNGLSTTVQSANILSRSLGTTAGTGDLEFWTSSNGSGVSQANVVIDWNGNLITPGTTGGNVYVGGGGPWVDVKSGSHSCAAAVGDGSTDDQPAIACQITWMVANLWNAGGVLHFPCGGYKVGSTVQVQGYIKILGENGCSYITTGGGDYTAVLFHDNSTQRGFGAGMEHMQIFCKEATSATTACWQVDNYVDTDFSDIAVFGGKYALYICGNCGTGGGGDNTYRKLDLNAFGTGGADLYSFDTVGNWYYSIKADNGFGAGTANPACAVQFLQDASGAGLSENTFFKVDMSGTFSTGSLCVNDTSGSQTVISMHHGIFGGTGGFGSLGTFRNISFTGSELGTGTVAITSGRLEVASSMASNGNGGTITFTGGTRHCGTSNDGVSCP